MKLISRAAFSDDGRKVLTVSENGPQVWDAETCRLISEPEVDHRSICAAAFSPDGRRLLLGCENRAEILDADTGARLAVLEGHTSAVTSAAFSLDGSRAATASDDGTVRIWDTETRTCLSVFHNVPGLDIVGVDLRRLHPESVLSDRARIFLYEYGAEVNREAGAGAQ